MRRMKNCAILTGSEQTKQFWLPPTPHWRSFGEFLSVAYSREWGWEREKGKTERELAETEKWVNLNFSLKFEKVAVAERCARAQKMCYRAHQHHLKTLAFEYCNFELWLDAIIGNEIQMWIPHCGNYWGCDMRQQAKHVEHVGITIRNCSEQQEFENVFPGISHIFTLRRDSATSQSLIFDIFRFRTKRNGSPTSTC